MLSPFSTLIPVFILPVLAVVFDNVIWTGVPEGNFCKVSIGLFPSPMRFLKNSTTSPFSVNGPTVPPG